MATPQSGSLSPNGTLNFYVNYYAKPGALIFCNGAKSTTINYGESAVIDLNFTAGGGSAYCYVDPSGEVYTTWKGTLPGSKSTGPLFTSQTYTLSCFKY